MKWERLELFIGILLGAIPFEFKNKTLFKVWYLLSLGVKKTWNRGP